jgi:hypothetical protein
MEPVKNQSENIRPSDATEYLISSFANKEWLDVALREAKNSEGVEIKLEDIWK